MLEHMAVRRSVGFTIDDFPSIFPPISMPMPPLSPPSVFIGTRSLRCGHAEMVLY